MLLSQEENWYIYVNVRDVQVEFTFQNNLAKPFKNNNLIKFNLSTYFAPMRLISLLGILSIGLQIWLTV